MLKRSKSLRIVLALVLAFCLLAQTGMVAMAQSRGSTGFSIDSLKTEYTVNPIGIDVTVPRFSWQMSSDARSQSQKAYQIMVSSSAAKLAAGDYDMWDSGEVEFDSSIGIAYGGKTIQATSKYFWKVKVWNQDGMAVESTEAATFETGLLGTGWGSASYIKSADVVADIGPSNYTFDFDFKITGDNVGVYFGAQGSENNCLMWQVNTVDFPGKTYFRPHAWGYGGGGRALKQLDITSVIPVNQQKDWHHMTIEVTDASNGRSTIVTKINGTTIDTYTTSNNYRANLRKIGFRHTLDGNVSEAGEFDNFLIQSPDKSTTYYSEDFSDAARVGLKFPDGVVTAEKTFFVAAGKKFVENDPILPGNSAPMFRKKITTDAGKTIESAKVYATARGIYDLYLNGEQIGEDYFNPGWTEYRVRFQYQTFDITDTLKTGDNVIGAVVGNGWLFGNLSNIGKGTYTSQNIGPKGIMAKIVIKYTDGSSQTINTDNTWKFYGEGPVIADDFQDGESYDARKEVPGWNTVGFDDSAWGQAQAAQANPKLITAQVGPTVREDKDITRSVVGIIKPDVAETDPNYGVTIYDMGQNMVGNVKVKLEGPAGTIVKMRFGEMIDVNQGNILYTQNLRYAKVTDYYILKGTPGGEWYTPRFTFHGFRYFEISANVTAPAAEDVKGIVLTSTTGMTSSFESSNALINQLYSNVVWGQRGNFLSVPTDCPQRDERMGWTGDARAFARTSTYNMDTNQFFEKWMRDVRDSQASDGSVTNVAPEVHTGGGANGWGDAVTIVPWHIYQQYGNTRIITENYDAMKKWVAWLANNSTNNIRGGGGFGDWLAVESTDTALTNTIFTAYSNLLLSKMAAVIEKDADSATYLAKYNAIKTAWQARYMNEDGTIKGNTQTSYAMAILAELIPEEKLPVAAEAYVNNIRDHGWHLTTGFAGTPYLALSLSGVGRDDISFRLLEQTSYPSWLYSVVNGATTIWERWNSYIAETGTFGDWTMNSYNHYSFGSIQEWMMRNLAGIEAVENVPGYKEVILQPTFGGSFTYANTSYDATYGKIVSDWSLNDNTFNYDFTIPANTTATLKLPTTFVDTITEGGAAINPDSSDIKFVGIEDGRAVYTVGSGSYNFEMQVDVDSTLNHALKINNPDGINAKVTINDEDSVLPYNELLFGGQKSIEVISNDVNYAFSHWTDTVAGKINPQSIRMTKDTEYTAKFKYVGGTTANAETTLNLDAGGGSFLINGEPQASPYTGTFATGTEVVIDVVPPADYAVTGWSGTPLKGNPAVVVMNGDVTAKVEYRKITAEGNLAAGKTVTSVRMHNGAPDWTNQNLTDGKRTGTGWTSVFNAVQISPDATADPAYFTIDLGSNTTFDTVTLFPRTDSESFAQNVHYFPQDYTISVSTNGTTFTPVKVVTGHADTAEPVTEIFDAVTARYVRVTSTKFAEKFTTNDGCRFQMAEVEVYNSANVQPQTLGNIDITEPGSIDKIDVDQTLILSADTTKDITWYIHETNGATFGIMSDLASGVVNGKSVTVTGLAEGVVDVVARANDGSAIGSYRVQIGKESKPKVEAGIVDKDGNPIENPSFETNAPFTVSVTTPADVEYIKLVNENGMTIGKTVVSVTDNGNGTKTWVMTASVATAGAGRVLDVYTAGSDKEYTPTGSSIGFSILSPEPAVVSAVKTTAGSANVNEEFTITVETTKTIDKVKLTNETGNSIGVISKSFVIDGNKKIWTLTVKIGTKGDRIVTVYGAPKDADYLEAGVSFNVTILKP